MNQCLTITTTIFVALSACWLSGCAAPQESATAPSGSAAFARFDEPWQKDLIQSTPPAYSRADRAAWRQGRGVFHLTIDSQTGRVRDVTVKQSTGHSTLDAAAVAALKQWRFRPGSWRQLDIPVTFKRSRTHNEYIERVRDAQQHQRTL
jgi:periplasmic protein TonB